MSKTQLVLIGGGHSHAIALKLWSQNPLPNIELTLISDVENTPYSGMLPGYVAGFYSYPETHINLPSLAEMAGAKLILDRAINLDPEQNLVTLEQGEPISFDYLSLDIGSTPKTSTTPGAREYAIAAKPVPLFLEAWQKILRDASQNPERPLKITIVGGGAGGVELALNIQARLRQKQNQVAITLVHRGKTILNGHNQKVSQLLTRILRERGIQLLLDTEVKEIQPQQIICNKNQIIPTDYTFWVTQADSPQWIKNSNLAKCDRGFLAINNYLQSISHPHIFATGDIATMIEHPRPKAGVFAVRQGKPLYNNWCKALNQQPLESYIPQTKYLALIGTGDKRAIASRGNFCFYSSLLWYLKDYIDRKFMQQFEPESNNL